MATLGQKVKNLQLELQEHRFNAIEGNSRPIDPNQKGRQNAAGFCNYCHTNGHTLSWCCKKIRNEQLKRIEKGKTAAKKNTVTQDYNRKRGPDHGSEQWVISQDLLRRIRNHTNDGPTRNSPINYWNLSSRPNFAYENNNPSNGRSYDRRPNQSFNSVGNRSRKES